MNYDVTQWLNEIESLQQQLAEARRERTEAESTAEHWRQLYSTEALQRREDAKAAQTEIDRLHAQLQQIQARPHVSESTLVEAAQQEVERLPADLLRSKSIDLSIECARLRQEVSQLTAAIQTEQDNHAKTRTELTTALGDTVSLLAKSKIKERSPLIPQFLSETSEPEEEATPESLKLEGVEAAKQITPSFGQPFQLPPADPSP
jgi:conjugal transfer/entry exclusion protein